MPYRRSRARSSRAECVIAHLDRAPRAQTAALTDRGRSETIPLSHN